MPGRVQHRLDGFPGNARVVRAAGAGWSGNRRVWLGRTASLFVAVVRGDRPGGARSGRSLVRIRGGTRAWTVCVTVAHQRCGLGRRIRPPRRRNLMVSVAHQRCGLGRVERPGRIGREPFVSVAHQRCGLGRLDRITPTYSQTLKCPSLTRDAASAAVQALPGRIRG
jgi:hypothetical protein